MNLKELNEKYEIALDMAENSRINNAPELEQMWLNEACSLQERIEEINSEAIEEHNTWRESFQADLKSGRYRRY